MRRVARTRRRAAVGLVIFVLAGMALGCGDDAEEASLAPTPQATATGNPNPSPTPLPLSPEISYFGVARADDIVLEPSGADAQGRPIFIRPTGQGMTLVIEARRLPGAAPLGRSAFEADGSAPDLQLLASRPLGNGDAAVCAIENPAGDGVPGFNPPVFSDQAAVIAAINDLGCRVNDGTGAALARSAPIDACTQSAAGAFGYDFVAPLSTIQFCLPIAATWSFPIGDTVVATRVRDARGLLSMAAELIIRVVPPA